MDSAPSCLPSSSSFVIASPSLDLSSVGTTSPTTQSFLHPFPSLPMELKREILRFCDPSTLAKTSRVSLAFLELSSPLLYDDVEITGFETMAKLSCPRDPSLHQPHLEPFLSLHRMRSCTLINGPSDARKGTEIYSFSRDRIPSFALPVETLKVDIQWIDYKYESWVWVQSWMALLSFFDPIAFKLADHYPFQEMSGCSLSSFPLDEGPSWARLERLEVVDDTPVRFPSLGQGFLTVATFDGAPERTARRSSGGRVVILMDVYVDRRNGSLYIDEYAMERLWGEDCLLDSEVVKEFVFRPLGINAVSAGDVWGHLRQKWDEEGVSSKVVERRSSRLTVEVANSIL